MGASPAARCSAIRTCAASPKSAVIGKTVADQLFPNEDPLGQTIRIRNLPFQIVGVLQPKGFNLFGQDQDDVVIVPYTSHMHRITTRTFCE